MFRMISKLLPIALVFFATVAHSQQAACVDALTRDCVLQMAVDRAVARDNPNRMTAALLQVAEFQHNYDPMQSQQTFDVLITLLEEREPDPFVRA